MKSFLLLATASLALVGCKSMSYDAVTTHAAMGGFKIDATGLTGGYGQTDFAQTPVVDQQGKLMYLTDACGAQHPISVYSILAGNAQASSGSTSTPGQNIAVAVNRGQAVGAAADRLAAAEELKAQNQTAGAGSTAADLEKAFLACPPKAAG